MDITIYPGKLCGKLQIIPSKSQAHRLLICAAFADKPTTLICSQTNADICATVDCLNALGAEITRTEYGFYVVPVRNVPCEADLNCGESGSTLRFLLPIAGALGVNAAFHMSGRLPDRPISPLNEEMERMGCRISKPRRDTLLCSGKLRPGHYQIAGNISSQFISGLMFALPLLNGDSHLSIIGKVESAPYIEMTKVALAHFGVTISGGRIPPSFPFKTPGELSVEGDWSNAAFFIAANALGSNVELYGLRDDSPQGDKACKELLAETEALNISVANIPDLVPILSVAAAAKEGAVFTQIERLRLKESDRVATTVAMLKALGISAEATDDTLTVFPGKIQSGTVSAENDHRIAMAAAVASTVADGPITILGAECVSKSYPGFWVDYKSLGGNYEQHIR